MLISLSPNLVELAAAREDNKNKCVDYIDLMQNKKLECDGEPLTVSNQEVLHTVNVMSDGKTGTVQVRKTIFEFNGREMTQLYFDGWPDAHGQVDPPVPPQHLIEEILEQAKGSSNVAIHCAGGRGRTGTVALGLVQKWHKVDGHPLSADRLVRDLVEMRTYRADFIEHPSQLMLLGKMFGLGSGDCTLKTEAV